ncbi:hypothetical protein JIY74_37595, partial [Vibrio harveyi]|nr:hypothetical protein [Vibrio harveyi]
MDKTLNKKPDIKYLVLLHFSSINGFGITRIKLLIASEIEIVINATEEANTLLSSKVKPAFATKF